MKIAYFIIGCILLVGSVFFLKDELINLEIQGKGHLVDMEIIDIPGSCLGTKAKWFMKVKYQDKIFSKQIPTGFCESYKAGDLIKLRYEPGQDRVLLPEESSTFELVAIGIVSLFGAYIIYLATRKT